ncbi:MAG TPA: Rieske (2Fe-2S) protein [Anaeromyxobacteraceae bacterium]|nr:Rieske (2Fe-2S) protein [Anaeromyxobacteraceae bacterium]
MSSTRRDFLRCAACGGAAAAVAALGGCAPGVDPAPLVDVPAPVNGRVTLAIGSYPQLNQTHGAARIQGPGISPPILLVRRPDGGFAALSSICTHKSCPLGTEGFEVVCPCHASRFDLQGNVTHPPAPVSLFAYSSTFDPATGELTVELLSTAGVP